MHWHVPPFAFILAIDEELAHEFFQRVAALLQYAGFTVLGEDDVGGSKSGGGAYSNAFFAGRDHVESKTALTLRVEHYEVEDGDC